jgi:tetratricopeptide (TPR) repeat protein
MNNIYQELQNEFAKGNYYSAISKALLLLQIEKGKETYLLANIILARSYFNLGMINDSIIPTLELCKYQIQASRGIAVDIIEYLGKNGQWNEAVNFAHEVLSVDPKNYAAARKCIRILLNIGDHEIAAILFNNYKTTSPTISTIFSSYFSSPQ